MEERYLTIALCKGRVANQTMELLENLGIRCDEIKDKSTRKLIFQDDKHKLRFFLAKGPDVPTYVEYGAADLGVVGSDIIEEEQRIQRKNDFGLYHRIFKATIHHKRSKRTLDAS